jgi:alpha-amylase/alpha-mannosidase (GH57 family)
MNEKNLCVHGHFYQPPRQDVLTGRIPEETGTVPYHNWNEKIHAECYKPNAELRNFEKISFNLGPTLFQWMEKYDPVTYQSIIEQESQNFRRNGVGNGMAQPYNHTILPLAKREDKITQIEWGIADFKRRFNHDPAGMWLPEAGVDSESLDLMAEYGIQYTILAPWQADTSQLDISHPYRVETPGGKSMVVFFYNMELSTRVSFDPSATTDADAFATQYVSPQFRNGLAGTADQLQMIASDGELYGHHQQFRDRFLARLLDGATQERRIQIQYPGLYIRSHEVTEVIKIRENTSWSCHHGVERWKTDCGCTPGSTWKEPMRNALNLISEMIDLIYTQWMEGIGLDARRIRNEYIHFMLGELSWNEFLTFHVDKPVVGEEEIKLKLILEAQVPRQWMFTSCGWFFDEFNRIEPRNNIGYAAQAIYLIEKATKQPLFPAAVDILRDVISTRTYLTAVDVFKDTYVRCQDRDSEYLRYVI